MSTTVRCPECHAALIISEHGTGEDVQCTQCRAVFRLREDLRLTPAADSVQQSPVRSGEPARSPETCPPSEAVRLRADNLNNQAVSLLSLGKPAGADQLFEKVVRIVPNHPQATFNRDLFRWRAGRMTDLALVRELDELRAANPGDWHPEYFLALVHAERGDIEAAIEHLKGAAASGGGPEVQTTLQRLSPALSESAHCRKVLRGHTRVITAVHVSDDARFALSGSWDGTICLWDLAEGACARNIDTQTEGCQCLAVTPDFRWAISANGSLSLWDLASGDRVRIFEGPRHPVTSLSVSADGTLALSGGGDQTVRLWEVATGRCLRTLEGHTSPIACASLSPDGRWAISGTSNQELWMWDVATGQRIRVFEVQEFGPECACLSRDGRWVLSGDLDAKLHLWSGRNGMRVRTLRGHTEKVTSVSLTADGRWALSGSLDETLRLWDVTTGCCVRTIEGHIADIFAVALSPDGRWGLSGGSNPSDPRDHAVRLWDFGVFQRPGGRFMAPAARCVLAGREEAKPGQGRFNGMLAEARSLVSSRRFEEALYLIEQARKIPSFALNPQALELRQQVGGHGVRERFRDGRGTRMLRGPASAVGSVALSPDASHALSGGPDKMVRLWDLAKGECECTLAGHAGPVNDVCTPPTGARPSPPARTGRSACGTSPPGRASARFRATPVG
jgi:WD40 repeat protein